MYDENGGQWLKWGSWYSARGGRYFSKSSSDNKNPNLNFMNRVARKTRWWAPVLPQRDHITICTNIYENIRICKCTMKMRVITCTASERPAKAIQLYWPFHLPQFDLVGLAWFISFDLAWFIKCNFDIVTDNLSLTSPAIVGFIESLGELVSKLAHRPKWFHVCQPFTRSGVQDWNCFCESVMTL